MSEKYNLNKCRKILEWSYGWYKKSGKTLNDAQLAQFEADLDACDQAYLNKDEEQASKLAQKLETFTNENFQKTPVQYILEIVLALAFALAIAILVRQMWFEPYEIPTGSMRPTFKEQDHLTVSKAQFGLNVPLKTEHFFFQPEEVKRAGIVIWSGDGIALRDTQSTYFGIVPYSKRYVKRLIGKPDDIIYFYGGKIYGIDKEGKAIEEFLNTPELEKIEHIPFLTFEGEITSPARGTFQFEQMHKPIGRLVASGPGEFNGEVFDGRRWVKDDPLMQITPHKHIKTFSDYWGIKNFAMTRLITKEQLAKYPQLDTKDLPEGILYLELIHHPNMSYPKAEIHREFGGLISISPYHTVIPVQERHIDALMNHMYTARFVVKDGVAKRYSVGETGAPSSSNPKLPGVPDGTYEFYYGKAASIGWGGISTELPKEHPLYSHDPLFVQTLFNMGIDWNTIYEPTERNTYLFPHRYAYFRDNDLYFLGGIVYNKEDPVLRAFATKEQQKQAQSTEKAPYPAFKDYGPPLKDGVIDVDFIKMYGLRISPKQYVVLGDNHAMSADSRICGFIPEENLQGVPEYIVWPPGDRWGSPNQPPYKLLTTSRLIVWGTVLAIAIAWLLWRRYWLGRPVFRRL